MEKNTTGTADLSSKKRLFYIDNLRIFLAVLVILQHLIVAYGGGTGK